MFEDIIKTLYFLGKWGLILFVGSWIFLACAGQLPSDPG
jgi:hypothetical protein